MVRREIVLPNPREEVWEALTDPERLEDWFANDVDLDLRPGGGASFRWSNGEERTATVTWTALIRPPGSLTIPTPVFRATTRCRRRAPAEAAKRPLPPPVRVIPSTKLLPSAGPPIRRTTAGAPAP